MGLGKTFEMISLSVLNDSKEISYFYKLNNSYKIWKDYDKECKMYMKDAQKQILSNTQFIKSLTTIEKKYISKNFNIDIY